MAVTEVTGLKSQLPECPSTSCFICALALKSSCRSRDFFAIWVPVRPASCSYWPNKLAGKPALHPTRPLIFSMALSQRHVLLLLAVSSLFVVISCQTVSTTAISSAASDAAAEATKYKSKPEDKYSDKYDDKEVGQPCTPSPVLPVHMTSPDTAQISSVPVCT